MSAIEHRRIPAAAYYRVSKEDLTIENQRAKVEAMAAGRGYELVEEFSDHLSGALDVADRPGLGEAMAGAARGQFRAVFVWGLDRFSRDASFSGGLRLVGELDRFHVALLSYSEPHIDSAGPLREALVTISMRLAEEERKKLGKRTREGLETRRQWLRERGSYMKTVRTKGGKLESWKVTALGRPRAEIPDAALAKAIELRQERGEAFGWRQVAKEVERLGLGRWGFALLAKRCNERVASLPGRKPFKPRGPRQLRRA